MLFYHAYLVAFVFYLTITLGAVLRNAAPPGPGRLERCAPPPGRGPQRQRRPMAVLFAPLAFNLGDVYSWADHKSADAGVPALAGGSHGEIGLAPGLQSARQAEAGHDFWLDMWAL